MCVIYCQLYLNKIVKKYNVSKILNAAKVALRGKFMAFNLYVEKRNDMSITEISILRN